MRTPCRIVVLLAFAALPLAALAGQADTPRVGLKVLPFTGLVWPHQQLAEHRPAPGLGVGLEIYYTKRFSLALDLSGSWHRSGPGEAQLASLQTLGRWWFPGEGWNPFVQVGLGGYQAEVDRGRGSTQHGGVGLSLGAGAEVPLRDRLFLQGEVRSNWVQGEEESGDSDLWMGHTQVLAWLGYKLP